jgi:aspartate racemase
MRPAHRVVGIIGGMGPEATVELMRRVIAHTPASDDQDHIHLIAESNPKIPSRMAHLIELTGTDPTPELIRIAQNLQRAGADGLAMPCNTAHCYASAIRSAVSIPLLDMVNLTVDRIAARQTSARVGLLASTAVHLTGIYSRAFAARGIIPVIPRHQEELMTLINGVKRGDKGPLAVQTLAEIARELAGQSELVLIACTELSLISAGIENRVACLDSLDVLTQAIVDFAGAEA